MKYWYFDLRGWCILCGHYCMYTCDTFVTRLLSTPSLTVGFNFSLHVCREMRLPNLHVICVSCVTDVAVSSFTHFFVTLQAFVFQSSGGTVCFCSPSPTVCCDSTEYQDKYFSVPCPSVWSVFVFFFNKLCWSDSILLHCYKSVAKDRPAC
jgi:hypothetical protein